MREPTRPPRWSKKTDDLLDHVAGRCPPRLQLELGHWLADRPRFREFVSANQDKVRKKLNASDGEESRLDVRGELRVAYMILADRRFEVSFETYGARRGGPDLSVAFRAHQRFNIEVTRIRGATEPGVARLADIIAGKLHQLPGELPNALVIVTRGWPSAVGNLEAAAKLLKLRSDQKDEEFFIRRGLKSARDFYAQYLHLSGVFILDEVTDPPPVVFFANREARRPLPREVVVGLSAALSRPR